MNRIFYLAYEKEYMWIDDSKTTYRTTEECDTFVPTIAGAEKWIKEKTEAMNSLSSLSVKEIRVTLLSWSEIEEEKEEKVKK